MSETRNEKYIAAEYLHFANDAFNKSEFERAIKLYTQVILRVPNHVTAHFNRGRCYFSINNYEQAIRDFNAVIAFYEKKADLKHEEYVMNALNEDERLNYIDALTFRGVAHKHILSLDHFLFGMNDLNNVIFIANKYNIKCPLAYETRGLMYYEANSKKENMYHKDVKKNYNEAIINFTKAIETGSYFFLYQMRGNAYYHLKKYTNALQDYYNAYRLEPKVALDVNKLEICLKEVKDFSFLTPYKIFALIKMLTDLKKQSHLLQKCLISGNPLGDRILDINYPQQESCHTNAGILKDILDYLKVIDHEFKLSHVYAMESSKSGFFKPVPRTATLTQKKEKENLDNYWKTWKSEDDVTVSLHGLM